MADGDREVELREVSASEVLEKIQKCESIEYDHVKIIGDLNLKELKLPTEKVARTEYQINLIEECKAISSSIRPSERLFSAEYQIKNLFLEEECKVISSSIIITNSKIENTVNFDNVYFKNQASFRDTSFGYANFRGATFSEKTNFTAVTFSEANFCGATFCRRADFTEAIFLLVPDKFERLSEEGTGYWRVFHGLFTGAAFKDSAFFDRAKFSEEADFTATTFERVSFRDAIFSRYVNFSLAKFGSIVNFSRAEFKWDANFCKAMFSKGAVFNAATFREDTNFCRAMFSEEADFTAATFKGNASINEVIFELAKFSRTEFEGDQLSFRNSTFFNAKHQEDAYRKAKIVSEKAGNKEEAEFYYYQEMDAKRKQKPWYKRYPEYVFIQLIFGYGVHPVRIWICWLGFVFLFAAIYAHWNGIDATESHLNGDATLIDYIWFSIATAITPGYAGYKPTSDFKLVAGFEAILGTLMWAAFIATFIRKYMK